MAINKNFTTPQGVLTTFHEIIRVEINASAGSLTWKIMCYVVDPLSHGSNTLAFSRR